MEKNDYVYYHLDGIKKEQARKAVVKSLNECRDARVNDEEYLSKTVAEVCRHSDVPDELACYMHNFNAEHPMVCVNPYNGKPNEEYFEIEKYFYVSKNMKMDKESCMKAINEIKEAVEEAFYWVYNNNFKSYH